MAEPSDRSHRLSAIVSIDAVGYSSAIAADPDGAVRTVRGYNERLIAPGAAAHAGSIRGRAGDSWLVEFAQAPDALAFSLAIQAAIGPQADLPLRIGINFGEVIEVDGEFHGTGINVAVRLQSIARPGGIALSASTHERLPAERGCEIRQIGPRTLKNIPQPVWVYRVVMAGEEDEAIGAPTVINLSHQVPGLGGRPAVAVLPFQNAQGDLEEEYFSDGLSEDIIEGLSRLRWLPVISRSSSFAFKHAASDLREIGRQLGARYIIGGSVYASQQHLRVHASLNEAENRQVVWTQAYDRERTDLFAVQDEIARGLVGAIDPELARAEQFRSRTRALDSLDEWELVRRGTWHMNRLTRSDARIAREFLDRALAANPESVEALVHLSWWHFWDVWTRRGTAEGWLDMGRFARRALALDGQDARAIMLAGIAECMQGEPDLGRRKLERAVELNPSLAVAHAAIGSAFILAGEPERAIAPLQTALRLSPNDFYIFQALGEFASARYMMGDYNLAIQAAEASLQIRPGYFYAHVVRVGSLARLRQFDRARAALKEFLQHRPEFTQADVEWLPFASRHWTQYLMEGLALAGYTPARP